MLAEFLFDLRNVREVARFDIDAQEAPDHRTARVGVFVMNARYVCAASGDNAGNRNKLPRFI